MPRSQLRRFDSAEIRKVNSALQLIQHASQWSETEESQTPGELHIPEYSKWMMSESEIKGTLSNLHLLGQSKSSVELTGPSRRLSHENVKELSDANQNDRLDKTHNLPLSSSSLSSNSSLKPFISSSKILDVSNDDESLERRLTTLCLDNNSQSAFRPICRLSHIECDTSLRSLNYSCSSSASSNSDMASDSVPTDAAGTGSVFVEQCLPETQEFMLQLSSAATIQNFWIHIKDHDSLDKLDLLMEDLDFYNTDDAEDYRIPRSCVKKGQIGAARSSLDHNWHRVEIGERHQYSRVSVFCVDYGTSEIVDDSQLMYLRKRHLTLPKMAVNCRLSHILSREADTSSDKKKTVVQARNRFVELCSLDKYSYRGRITSIQNKKLSLVIVATRLVQQLSINDQLIREGLAYLVEDTGHCPQVRQWSFRTKIANHPPARPHSK